MAKMNGMSEMISEATIRYIDWRIQFTPIVDELENSVKYDHPVVFIAAEAKLLLDYIKNGEPETERYIDNG